jgi:hypothetical protein
MARYGWKDISDIFVSGYDVQVMKTLEVELPKLVAVVEELPAAGEEWTEKSYAGRNTTDGTVTLLVPMDDAVDGSEDAFVTAAHLTDAVVAIGIQGGALGKKVWGFNSHQIDYGHEPDKDGSTKLRVTFDPDGELHQLRLVAPKQIVTADGDTTGSPLDNAASSANGGVALLQVADLDLDGGTALDVRLQDSSDDITYVDLVDFDDVSGARSGQIKTVAGTVDRYLTAWWDYTGTPGGSATAKILVAFKRS